MTGIVGAGSASLPARDGPAVNPVGISGAAVAVFVSNGDEPGASSGLLMGNRADGGEGGTGGVGGVGAMAALRPSTPSPATPIGYFPLAAEDKPR
ncbi:MAG TPA: hypothetical protein VFK56_14960 [Mycobacterium sp.]|nr:hypothetical protein [Mycobacterium sp.]